MKNKAFIFGPFLITTFMQALGAPIIDSAISVDNLGRTYKGYAILLTPWKRNQYGDRDIQLALMIGWKR